MSLDYIEIYLNEEKRNYKLLKKEYNSCKFILRKGNQLYFDFDKIEELKNIPNHNRVIELHGATKEIQKRIKFITKNLENFHYLENLRQNIVFDWEVYAGCENCFDLKIMKIEETKKEILQYGIKKKIKIPKIWNEHCKTKL